MVKKRRTFWGYASSLFLELETGRKLKFSRNMIYSVI